jgi:hypothetical protein
MEYFVSALGNSGVITDSDKVLRYNSDWIGKYVGQGKVVLCPKDAQELSKILAHCNNRKYVCPINYPSSFYRTSDAIGLRSFRRVATLAWWAAACRYSTKLSSVWAE